MTPTKIARVLASSPALRCQLVAVIAVVVLFLIGPLNLAPGRDGPATIGDFEMTRTSHGHDASGGHWEFRRDVFPPYNFSQRVCEASHLDRGDCAKTATCPSDLMNWAYVGGDGEPYPRFDTDGFRSKMRDRRIVFVGCSVMRQQVQALAWTLGHESVDWDATPPPAALGKNCTTSRTCLLDVKGNITICHQFMGSMATGIYREGNRTLDHSRRGHGDSSCLLRDEMIAEISGFDLALVQEVAWWTNLPNLLDSPTSPREWVLSMVPAVYRDAMRALLSRISERSTAVFVLGQIGVNCKNKTSPEPFEIPHKYGWNLAPKLWDTALTLIEEEGLNVQVVDAREPLMQSVHAHPSPDCMHFCMNSAALNIYLDMYWTEVFSHYAASG